jgi:arginine deiminase
MSWVDSEYGLLQEVALCRPDYYGWAEANAIVIEAMARGLAPDVAEALRQFDGFAAMLERAGVKCRHLEPDPHLCYQTFTRDTAVMTPWGLLIANMARQERRAEWAAVHAMARALDLPVWRAVTAGSLEGGDVQVLRPGTLVIGVNDVRTSKAGADQVAGWFRGQGWEVKFVRVAPHFLHLDVLFSVASESVALCATECLADGDVAWFRGLGLDLIDVSYRDAMKMGCNVTALGNNRVISSAQHEGINAALRARGLEVMAPDLGQFLTEGGGSHCLTMPLRRTSPAC